MFQAHVVVLLCCYISEKRTQCKTCTGSAVAQCLTQDRGFEPHRRHCIVVLEQDTFILA